ncbi:MAG: type II toxin-antitoxin system RelE/ParE family toxin [Campylobacterota bacterium]|nr:type II toxin-antitoxin system RelE/ParE family toxin [Campylobacterota bacterium]
MDWNIEYFNSDVESKILSLPDGLLARYLRLTDIMIIHGSNLGLPHTKALSNGLFELRLKSKEGIGRVFYCTKVGKNIIMLHSFIKKSQKIPKNEMDIALKRLREVKENDS